MSNQVFNGRYTAETSKEFVVFIIGMRVNKWWRIHQWLPVALAMPKMMQALIPNKSLGMIHGEHFFRFFPITTTLISYWETFEQIDHFAHDKNLPHAKAWAQFIKSVGNNGAVGIYHENYKVKSDSLECVYGNMPQFGLGKAFKHIPVTKENHTARQRMNQNRSENSN